jgi:hypothetical protein
MHRLKQETAEFITVQAPTQDLTGRKGAEQTIVTIEQILCQHAGAFIYANGFHT